MVPSHTFETCSDKRHDSRHSPKKSYVDLHDLPHYQALEARYISMGRLATGTHEPNSAIFRSIKRATTPLLKADMNGYDLIFDVEKRTKLIDAMMEIAEWNKAIKRDFWKSMKCYQHVVDETESCLLLQRIYLEAASTEARSATLGVPPTKKKSRLVLSPGTGSPMSREGFGEIVGLENDELCFETVSR
ncbi:hypothetical protein BC829DRAFT_259001 [Chytridium lagenaria]|nr:hypothetical protein BC829DRAFT_259001 [Chytridium lagenaria]